MSRRHFLMLLLLSAIWGASFMFIKVAVRDLSPATSVLGRVPNVLPIAVVGVLNSALPFWLLFWAETRIDSGLAAILQASAPLFTVLLALAFVRSERVGGLRLLGFLVGFGGVALLVGSLHGGSVLAGVTVIGTALCYAAAALYTGRRLAHVPTLLTAFGSMIAATLVSLPAGLAQLPTQTPDWKAIGSVVALGVGGSAVAYLLYYGIITGAGASRAILVTYLVPAIALLYGVTLLGEPLGASDLAGLALILAGVALGTGTGQVRRRRKAVDSLPA